MPPNVALGPIEVAGTVSALADGLRAVGADAEVVLRERHPFDYPADRQLGRISCVVYGVTAGLRRDVLHYQYGSTWLRGHLDARTARRAGCVRVVTFHGDDCRLGSVAKRLFPARGRVKSAQGDDATRTRLAGLAPFCDAAIVNDFELATYVRPYFERVYLLPVPVSGPRPGARPPRPREARLVVLHAPSDPVAKGTDAIAAAVDEVAARHPIEFKLLHGVPHATVQAEIERCDVVIDQLNSVTTGIFALESMRRGLPVCGEIDRAVLAPFQQVVPLVDVTADTLVPQLERLVTDEAHRAEVGERGREFVERVHAAPQVATAALRIYDHVRDAAPGIYIATPEGVAPVTPPSWVEEGV